MKTAGLTLVILVLLLCAGCEHLVEANSEPPQKQDNEDAAKDRWWQRIDWNDSGGKTAR